MQGTDSESGRTFAVVSMRYIFSNYNKTRGILFLILYAISFVMSISNLKAYEISKRLQNKT